MSSEGKVVGSGSLPKFVILSIIGVVVFFVPIGFLGGVVPMVAAVNTIKKLFGENLPVLALLISGSVVVTLILGKVLKKERFVKHHTSDGPIKTIFYVIGFVLCLMYLTKTGPEFLLASNVGGEALYLAATIFLTISMAGFLVCFILDSGVVEFIAVLIEPIMRPVYLQPGEAAVDAVSAFVSSAAVGVYLTDQHYQDKRYTVREAFSVVTCYCVMSIGYLAVISEMSGIPQFYGQVVLVSFAMIFIVTPILVRIPPISLKKNTYIDGTVQTKEMKTVIKRENRFKDAVEAGIAQSAHFSGKTLWHSFLNAISFGQTIVGFLIPVVVLVMAVIHYTPIFTYLGQPMVPILNLLQIPAAEHIAPATLVGIVDVSFPSVTIMGLRANGILVPDKSAFFITVLAALQIISFTESANAMMQAKFGAKFLELVAMFFIRTIVIMPFIALFAHLLF